MKGWSQYLLGCLTILVICLCTPAMASAGFLLGEEEIPIGEQIKFAQVYVFNEIETTIAKLPAHISCSQEVSSSKNYLEGEGRLTGEAEQLACTVYLVSNGKPENQPHCQVTISKLNYTGTLSSEETSTSVIKLVGSGEKEALGAVTLEEVHGAGPCVLTGKYELKGYQSCSIPNAEDEGVAHIIVCDPPNSGLSLGEQRVNCCSGDFERNIKQKVIAYADSRAVDVTGATLVAVWGAFSGIFSPHVTSNLNDKPIEFKKVLRETQVVTLEEPRGGFELQSIAIEAGHGGDYAVIKEEGETKMEPCIHKKIHTCRITVELLNEKATAAKLQPKFQVRFGNGVRGAVLMKNV